MSSEKCNHEFLMRHDYGGEIWWQCQDGCDFLFRSTDGADLAGERARLNEVRKAADKWREKTAKHGYGKACAQCADDVLAILDRKLDG